MIRGKGGVEANAEGFIDASEMRSTLLIILPTPVDPLAHVLIIHTGANAGAGVVRVGSNILTVLIGVETLETAVCVVTVRGQRDCPALCAVTIP